MTLLEIIMILVGAAFILVSFFIQEKLSSHDVEAIARMSEKELSVIVEKKVKATESKIEDLVEEIIEEKMAESKRGMEKTCNEKIMAISEYSDTVLDAINKSHNEIMFLYSMLNDKHKELTGLAGELQEFTLEMKNAKSEVERKMAVDVEEASQRIEEAEPVPQSEFLRQAVHTDSERNHNEDILFLHNAGKTDVEIAKELGLGLGEVKLVIGLFMEGGSGAV